MRRADIGPALHGEYPPAIDRPATKPVKNEAELIGQLERLYARAVQAHELADIARIQLEEENWRLRRENAFLRRGIAA